MYTPSVGPRNTSNTLSGSGNTSSGERGMVTIATDCPGSKVTTSETSEKSIPSVKWS